MCRYVQYSYKKHYACFRCRKVFRRPSPWQLLEADGKANRYDQLWRAKGDEARAEREELDRFYFERTQKCPQCSAAMADMGMDLKAPKKSDIKEWSILESLYRMGRRFQSCGCDGPGYIPRNPSDHRRYLEEIRDTYRTRLEEAQAVNEGSRAKKAERVAYWADRLARVDAELDALTLRGTR